MAPCPEDGRQRLEECDVRHRAFPSCRGLMTRERAKSVMRSDFERSRPNRHVDFRVVSNHASRAWCFLPVIARAFHGVVPYGVAACRLLPPQAQTCTGIGRWRDSRVAMPVHRPMASVSRSPLTPPGRLEPWPSAAVPRLPEIDLHAQEHQEILRFRASKEPHRNRPGSLRPAKDHGGAGHLPKRGKSGANRDPSLFGLNPFA